MKKIIEMQDNWIAFGVLRTKIHLSRADRICTSLPPDAFPEGVINDKIMAPCNAIRGEAKILRLDHGTRWVRHVTNVLAD